MFNITGGKNHEVQQLNFLRGKNYFIPSVKILQRIFRSFILHYAFGA